ncbi:MAG: PKD domain-containing protein [Cytophagales bacterium]|nr:MAG: PKD domain-containing protein [Cytophagales bacterium]
MKRLLSLLLVLTFYLPIFAQSGLFESQIQSADWVVEGEILLQRSYWNKEHTFIFTQNTVKVYKTLKGNITSETIEVVSIGGQVESQMMTHSGIMPKEGDAGLFMVKQNLQQNDLVHGSFVLYDKLQKKGFSTVAGVFEDIEQDLYKKVAMLTGSPLSVKNPNSVFYESKPKSSLRTEAINVESFIPATVTAGTRTKLTINGSGFGNTRGANGNVLFSDARTGGTTFTSMFTTATNQPELISWSDTKIEVFVPFFAGTGTISVINNNKEEFRTIDVLNVEYSVVSVNQGNTATGTGRPNADLVNSNGRGGYTVFISPDFFENRMVLGVLSNAFTTWRCNTTINVEMSELQSPINFGAQGISSIIIAPNIPGGLLSDVFSVYNNCNIGAGNNWRLAEFQMVLNLPALQRQNIDIATQFLVLLGRASQLGYVNDPKDLMFYRLNAGERKTISDKNKKALNQILTQSAMPNDCGTAPMQPTTAANCNNSIQAPVARFSSDKTALCDKGEVVFKDESRNAIAIQWSFQGGEPATSTDKNPKVSYTTAGVYGVKMTVTNPAGTNTLSQDGYIVVGKSGQLKLNLKDTVVCQGKVIRLDAGNAGAIYLWSNGATTQTIDVKNANTYSVVVTKDGCSITGSSKISFANSTPVDAGQNLILCEGKTGQLSASGGTSYSWSPATGLSSTTIPNPTVKASKTTVYYVSINTGGICGIIRDSVLVSVVPAPTLDLSDTTVFCGTTNGALIANNLAGGIGQDGVTYRWNTGATTPFLNVSTAGKYSVTATTREGCISSDTTVVQFVQAIKANVTSNTTICEGGQLQLRASGGQIYRWQPATGLSDPAIANPIAKPTVTTTYTVTVAAQGGGMGGMPCTPATATVTITVVPKPTLNLGKEITSCDASVLLDAKIPNSKYLWSDKSTNQTLRVTKSGIYKVSVSTPTCADILTDSVKVNFITLDLGKDTVITCDKTITLDTKIANAQYKWSDGSTAQTLRVSKSGKYKVSVTLPNCSRMLTDSVLVVLPELNIGNGRDSMRVCTSELTLDAFNNAPNTDFTWSGGSKNQTLKVNKDGWYKVTVNRRDCNIILVDSIYVSFFKVNLGKDIVTCQNEITLNAGNSGARYLWNDAKKSTTRTLKVTDSGTYLVTVTDTCGAVAQSSIIVVFNRLKSNITGDTLFACQKPYVLDAGNKGVAASYLWNDGTKNQTLSIDKDGLYSVAMTDSCKNQLTNRIFVTFAKPTLNFPDTMRTCTDSLILNPRIRQGVFTWSDGSSLPRLRVSQAGKYWVSIRTACGDILRDTVQAIFNRVPKADFNFQISATQGGSVVFNNTSTGEDTDEYLWEFGDGKISRERNPIYIFQQVGNFKVSLTVRSKFCGTAPKVEKNVNITVSGAEDYAISQQVSIYPNPSENGFFTLKHSLGSATFKLRMTDMIGKTWDLPEIKSVENKIDLSMLPKGLYLLEMQNTQYRVVKKLLIQ